MKLKKLLNKQIIVVSSIVIVIAIITIIAIIQNNSEKTTISLMGAILEVSPLEADGAISSASAFIKIVKENEAIVAVIENPQTIKERFPFLQQSFKGDLLISTSDQTVIFDKKTNQIRDISNKSIYKEIQQLL